jgi:diaminohydroxyphosphoribosylaminopyrimidine deaminase/5-amino-6-(5-phosphoribosylamino)uracil reductase
MGGLSTLVATTADAPAAWRASIEATGAELVPFAKKGDHLDLEALLRDLASRDIVTLLVEGGGVLLGGFFDRSLVDKVHAIIAPIIVGAADAPGAVAGEGAYRMADALRLRDVIVERLGEDILVTGYPVYVARTE